MRTTISNVMTGLLLCGSLAAGCGHTHTVGSAADEKGGVDSRGHEAPPTDQAAQAAGDRRRSPGAAHAVERREAPHETPPSDQKPPVIPLSTSAAGLLKPGAEKKIQDKLADGGLLREEHPSGEMDAPTREALRRFQKEHDLPATGEPDDATVRKLGLKPDDVFRSGEPASTTH